MQIKAKGIVCTKQAIMAPEIPDINFTSVFMACWY
jgi:hypothetical protein